MRSAVRFIRGRDTWEACLDTLGAKRLSARLSNAFVLDLVKLGRDGRDIIDPLIRTALLHAGASEVMRNPALQVRYATLAEHIPDDLRRPVSVNAIAESLGIPFETVRRRIAALAEKGVCRPVDKGVIVPSAVTDSPFFHFATQVQYAKLGALYRALRDFDLVEAPQERGLVWAAPPFRLVGRYTAEFVLRYRELVAEHVPDVVSGVVLMDIICANTEHLSSETADGGIGSGGLVPDRRRKPATAARLAERLGIPPETIRRHLGQLARQGLCERVAEGYVTPAVVIASPPFERLVQENHRNLERLFAQLAAYGVLRALEMQAVKVEGRS